MLLMEGIGEAQIQLSGLQTVFMLQPRHLIQNIDLYPFIRLQANGQLILRQRLIGVAEQVQRWILK